MKNRYLLHAFIGGVSFFLGLFGSVLLNSGENKIGKHFRSSIDDFGNVMLIDDEKGIVICTNGSYVNVFYKQSYLTFGLSEDGFDEITLKNKVGDHLSFTGYDADGNGVWDRFTSKDDK